MQVLTESFLAFIWTLENWCVGADNGDIVGLAEKKGEFLDAFIHSSGWNKDVLQQSSFDCKAYSLCPVVSLWFPIPKEHIPTHCFL